jgi:benzaldehyde dehydrogenase (NAD)
MASSRHIVHEKVAGQYLEALTARAQRLTVGDPTDADVQLGPMINAQQYDRVTRILEDSISAGARLIAGGTGKTPFFASTVVCDVTVDMPVWRQEIFGPIAPVMTFATDDEAIALSNDTEYGLSAGIYTPATERGRRIAEQLRTGMTHVGDQTVNDGPATPFGGVGASGNGGRFGGPASIEEFTQWRWMTERNVPAVYPF